MALLDFVTVIAGHVEARPLQDRYREIIVPIDDDPVDENFDLLGYADGQSFMIEYVDSKGKASTRRITVYSIVSGAGGVPLLTARCHERQAQRQFRTDRIRCCIDYDGEVHEDVPRFIMDTFGMSFAFAHAKESDDQNGRWKAILEIIRNDAVLLAALSRVDGKVVTSETSSIVDFLAVQADKGDFFLDDREVASIESYVKRLRPSADAIGRALDELCRAGPDQIRRVLRAAVLVMEADEVRHPEEVALINAMAFELTGLHLT